MKEGINTFPGLNVEQMPFAIKCFGTSEENEEKQNINADLPANVMGYVAAGSGTVEYAGGVLHLSAGDSYLLRANETYRFCNESGEPWTRIWVEVAGNIVVPVLDAYGLTHSMCFKGISILEQMKQIHSIAVTFSNRDLIMEQCCDVFVKICQYIRQQLLTQKKESIVSEDIQVLKEYLDTHLSERFTLESCSEAVSLSVSQLIRKFRAAYGMPPYEYLNQRRIEAAKQLLVETTYSVQKISELVGFQDPYYFSKYFKKKCGKSPKLYRELSTANGM